MYVGWVRHVALPPHCLHSLCVVGERARVKEVKGSGGISFTEQRERGLELCIVQKMKRRTRKGAYFISNKKCVVRV